MSRTESYAQSYKLTPVDKLGVWLSSRQIRRWVPTFSNARIGDIGCGYQATFVRTILPEIASATLVDVQVNPELKANPKVTALEGDVAERLPTIPDASLDVVMCISVLEHLWDPEKAVAEMFRILAPGGTCLLNVPSWRGKRFLEFSAFRLGLSPADEMDDHKIYYDTSDFWPLLVRAGFRPKHIRCFAHKFGLNTFAACRKPEA
jgi:SAM-dependent methyltransferase